jgi:protein-tyrosine phosphatase
MRKTINALRKGTTIVRQRFKTQGVRTTLLWFLVRGTTFLTGIPTIRYSRISPQIYVGPQYRARGMAKLVNEGIRAGLNLRVEFDDAAHGLALPSYCHLPTVDDTPPSLEHLQRGIEFVDQAVKAGEKVYIHCAGGIGRAPTMAAAYFISQGDDLAVAIRRIRTVRPFIRIMPSQMDQLEKLEAQFRNKRRGDQRSADST